MGGPLAESVVAAGLAVGEAGTRQTLRRQACLQLLPLLLLTKDSFDRRVDKDDPEVGIGDEHHVQYGVVHREETSAAGVAGGAPHADLAAAFVLPKPFFPLVGYIAVLCVAATAGVNS